MQFTDSWTKGINPWWKPLLKATPYTIAVRTPIYACVCELWKQYKTMLMSQWVSVLYECCDFSIIFSSSSIELSFVYNFLKGTVLWDCLAFLIVFFFFSKTKVTVKGLSFLELNTFTIKWVKICDSVQCDSVTVSRDVRPFFEEKKNSTWVEQAKTCSRKTCPRGQLSIKVTQH